MKKLLTIFSSFGIVMPNSLIIIACLKKDKENNKIKDYQAVIDKAEAKLEALEDVEVRMELKDVTLTNAIEEVKKNQAFANIINNKNIKLSGDLKLSKDANGSIAVTKVKHGLLAYVSGKIQHSANPSIETDFYFPAKIRDEHQAAIDDAATKLEALENIAVQIENLTSSTSVKTIIDEIKKNEAYTSAIDDKNIRLLEDLKLSKDTVENYNFTSNDFKHATAWYVLGTLEHVKKPTVKTKFKFSIQLKDKHQFEVNCAAKDLVKTFEKYQLKLDLVNITSKTIVDEIKKNKKFTDIVDNSNIKLFEDLKLSKNDKETKINSLVTSTDLINGAKINVLGKIQHGINQTTKAEFRFAITLVSLNSEIKKSKFDLSKITINKVPSLYIDSTKRYLNLNPQIANSIEQINEMKNIPLPQGYEISYYVLSSKFNSQDNDFSYAKISPLENQKEGEIWIEITADANNPTWKGSTSLMQFTLKKRSLNQEVKKLTNIFNNELELKIASAKNYMELNEQVINALEFNDKPITKYIIKYFTWDDDLFSYGWHEINQEEVPVSDYIYVEITASDAESTWKDETDRILIWLGD